MESYSLTDKLVGKTFVAAKDVLGCKIEFRVLSNPERVAVWRKYGTADLLSSAEAIAIPTLARAIISVDGITWDKFNEIQALKREFPARPVVELVEQYLSSPDISFAPINLLYSAYAEVVDEQQRALESLKKSSAVTNPVPSGSSVVPSEPSQPISILNLTGSTGNGPSTI